MIQTPQLPVITRILASHREVESYKGILRPIQQPCWNAEEWTDEDAGAFLKPTERAPLILIINQDMAALREFRQALAKRNTEQDVQRKLNKYTSHITFHLYQMYQETIGRKDDDVDAADAARRAEVHRVGMTLIKLMDVAEK